MENLVDMIEQSDSLVMDFDDWDEWESFDNGPDRLQHDSLPELFGGELYC